MIVTEKNAVLLDSQARSRHDEVGLLPRDNRPKGKRTLCLVGGLLMTLFLIVSYGQLFFINGPQLVVNPMEISGLVDQEFLMQPAAPSYEEMEFLPKQCRDTPHRLPKVSETLTLNLSHSLAIVQRIDTRDTVDKDTRLLAVSGAVIFRQTDNDHPVDQVDVETVVNDEGINFKTKWDPSEQHLIFLTPLGVKGWKDSLGPCMQIRITVWAAPESTLVQLTADTVHLNIDILEGLDMQVQEKSILKSVAGKVTAPEKDSHPSNDDDDEETPYSLNSREITIQTTSGKITGWYPLYDLLKMHTVSGDITTSVGRNDVLASDPKPAVLDVSTNSGKISLVEGLHTDVPDRDYVVNMESVSGSIHGEVAMSSRASFVSQSGHLDLQVWPILKRDTAMPDGAAPSLATSSRSSSTTVKLLEPLWMNDAQHPAEGLDGETPLSDFNSKHTSISGSINLHYPASWTGHVRAQTISGSQKFSGKGLDIHKQGFIPKVLVGRKGEGASELVVESVSGDETFLVGQDDQDL